MPDLAAERQSCLQVAGSRHRGSPVRAPRSAPPVTRRRILGCAFLLSGFYPRSTVA